MLPAPESACFLIADISGYTLYLTDVELDHAQDIIADVIDTVVNALRPPFRVAKFEGDAVFAYAATASIEGQHLRDIADAAYLAFRRRLRNIDKATSCQCRACSNIQGLDLKFVVHLGDYVTLTTLLPAPGAPPILMSYVFEDRPGGGSGIEIRIARPKPEDEAFVTGAAGHFEHTITDEVEVLRGLLAADAGTPAVVDEPAMPSSGERHRTGSVTAN